MAGILFLLAIAIIGLGSVAGVMPSVLVRDPAAEFQFPFYAGAISYLGIAILLTAAAITGFASRIGASHHALLTFLALFSGLLALDDLFLMHELVVPRYLGLSEKTVYAAYGVGFLAICWRVWALRTFHDPAGFLLALALLGASVLADIADFEGSMQYWLEDTLKLAGFGAWLTFWAQFSATALRDPAVAGGSD